MIRLSSLCSLGSWSPLCWRVGHTCLKCTCNFLFILVHSTILLYKQSFQMLSFVLLIIFPMPFGVELLGFAFISLCTLFHIRLIIICCIFLSNSICLSQWCPGRTCDFIYCWLDLFLVSPESSLTGLSSLVWLRVQSPASLKIHNWTPMFWTLVLRWILDEI